MLVSQMTTDILREWSETDDDVAKVSLVESWIRNALDDFALLTNFRVFYGTTSMATVATQGNYTLSPATQNVVGIRLTATDETIEERDKQELILSNTDLEIQGKPRFWYYLNAIASSSQQALAIQFYPIPDAIYAFTVSGVFHPAALISTDVLPVHNEHLNIIKNRVRYYCALDDKDYELADRHDEQFVRGAQLILQRENKRPAQSRRLRTTDVPSRRDQFVRLDPNHFTN